MFSDELTDKIQTIRHQLAADVDRIGDDLRPSEKTRANKLSNSQNEIRL